MESRIVALLTGLLVVSPFADVVFGQQPNIPANRIVNAATYNRDDAFPQLAPGSIGTIFGTNLASGAFEVTEMPLPKSALGTRVSFNGVDAPLYYVSPTQINFQVPISVLPPGTTGARQVTVTVNAPSGQATGFVLIAPNALGVFTADRSGRGPGAITINSPDPNRLYLSASNPARPGEIISVYATGLGATNPVVPDGEAPPADPLARSVLAPTVIIGGIAAPVSYSGRSTYVGLDQINVQIPLTVTEGCAVPMQILVGNSLSQQVPLFIRSSGNCN